MFFGLVTCEEKGWNMSQRTVHLVDAATRAASAMRAASQALSLMEATAAEEELCGLLARTLSREADRLERSVSAKR